MGLWEFDCLDDQSKPLRSFILGEFDHGSWRKLPWLVRPRCVGGINEAALEYYGC